MSRRKQSHPRAWKDSTDNIKRSHHTEACRRETSDHVHDESRNCAKEADEQEGTETAAPPTGQLVETLLQSTQIVSSATDKSKKMQSDNILEILYCADVEANMSDSESEKSPKMSKPPESVNIPAFLTKLWLLVEDMETNSFIKWSDAGNSFIVFDPTRFAKEVLPKHFKHNNMTSFVRQLNIYGFRKKFHPDQGGLIMIADSNNIEFEHPKFLRGNHTQLATIKRKMTNKEDLRMKAGGVDQILTDVKQMKNKQEGITGKLENIQRFTYEELSAFASYIKKRAGTHHPRVGIIAGSGQGMLVDAVKDPVIIPYAEVEGLPQSTVAGHSGEFVFGTIGDHEVMVMSGRLHIYEGYPAWKVTAPIRIMHLLGIKTLIATNAAGSISKSLKIGDIVIIKDHIYLPGLNGNNPLIGPNDENFGPRFLDTSKPYAKTLRQLTKMVATDVGLADIVKEGVYCMVSGPMYESPAEVRYLRMIGADVVGMSTCPEVITAIHCGMEVLAMTMVTDVASDDIDDEGPALTHQEVLKVAAERAGDIKKLIEATVKKL